ncbi:hypothetical protein pb186bvf_008298 [Paramecium bursaria]
MEQNDSTGLYKRLEVNLKKFIVESTSAFDYPEFGTVAKKFKNQFQDSKEKQWTYFEVFQQQDTRELLARIRKNLIADLFEILAPQLQKLYEYNDGDNLNIEMLSYECMRNLGGNQGGNFDERESVVLSLINKEESAKAQTEDVIYQQLQ